MEILGSTIQKRVEMKGCELDIQSIGISTVRLT